MARAAIQLEGQRPHLIDWPGKTAGGNGDMEPSSRGGAQSEIPAAFGLVVIATRVANCPLFVAVNSGAGAKAFSRAWSDHKIHVQRRVNTRIGGGEKIGRDGE